MDPPLLLLYLLLPAFVIAIADLNCTSNGVYTPQAVACQNTYSDSACGLVYENLTAVTEGGSDERPEPCFNGTTGPSEDIKNMAMANCPRTCGYCCQTPAYACSNAQFPRLNCGTITNRMCMDPTWRQIVAQDCPSSCGFCLEGGCIDAAPDCNLNPTICRTIGMEDFVAANCQRTCGLCSSSNATTVAGRTTTAAGGSCVDQSSSCASWVRNGFCTSTFYDAATKRKCAKSCNLC